MNMEFITEPLIGGLIGLVTNGLAIRMLFRPLRPVYIGKFKLPFTPGLIPKERARIASSIGAVVSGNLLDKDTLKKNLLSAEMQEQIITKLDMAIAKYASSEETVAALLARFISMDENAFDEKLKSVQGKIAGTITRKALEQDIGAEVADYACEGIISKMNPVIRTLAQGAVNSFKKPLANRINEMVDEKSGPLIKKLIEAQSEELLQMPLKDVVERYQDKIPMIKKYFWDVYADLIENKLADILESINISNVIENKILELDLLEMEKLIMSLMKKELNALVWLGGLLGLIMGFINIG